MNMNFTYIIDNHKILNCITDNGMLERVSYETRTILYDSNSINQIYKIVHSQINLLKSRNLHPTFLRLGNMLYEQIAVDSFNRYGNGFPDKFLELIILLDENADPFSPKVYCTPKEELDSNGVIHDLIHEYRRK